jgi:branched-chain amino acid transport system substrate-binding protein
MPSVRTSGIRRALVTVVALVVAAAAACTTNETASTPTSGVASDTPTTTPGTAANGSPIMIGWVNMEQGAAALPEITQGVDWGVDRVNKQENGINGHPIQLVKCGTDGTPEKSAGCANQFVSAKVVAVLAGGDLGTDAMIPILKDAGIAILGTSTLGTSMTLNAAGAFMFSPPATSYPQAEVDLAKEVGATKISMVLPDVSQVPIVQGLAEKQAALNGVTVSVVKFDPAAPDFAAAIAAVTANGSDAIATIATDDWCTGMARAALSGGFQGKLIMGTCTKYVRDVDITKSGGAYGLSSLWGPTSKSYAPDPAKVVIDQFLASAAEHGQPNPTSGILFGGYASVGQVANVLRTIGGDLTNASVMTGMQGLTSAPNPLGQTISCSPRPYPGTSACTKGWLWFQAVDANTAKPVQPDFVTVKS